MQQSRPALLVALAGLVLAVAMFRDLLFGARILFERDLMTVWYPQAASFARCWAAGSWPVWDAWVGFGQPLLAQPEAQVAYPFAWLRLALAPPDYYLFFVVAHFVFSGAGLYLFLRRLSLGRLASAVGGAIWITSGPFMSTINLWHHFASVAWAPWVLLATLRLIDRPQADRLSGLALVVAMQLLAGSAEMTALTLGATAFLVAGCLSRRPPPASRARPLALCAGAWVVGLMTVAVVWLPTATVARESVRWGGLAEETRVAWSVHPLQLSELVTPVALDDFPLSNETRRSLFAPSVHPFLKSVYLGLPSLVLGIALLCRGPGRPERWPWLALGGCCLLVSLGLRTPAYGAAVALLPPLAAFRYPSKAMLGVALGWAILSAIGLDSLREVSLRPRGLSWRWASAAAMLVVVAIGALGAVLAFAPEQVASLEVFGGHADARLLRGIGLRVLTSGVLATAAFSCAVLPLGTALARSLAVGMLVVLDLTLVTRTLNRTAPRSLLAFRPPLLEQIRAEDHTRVYVYDYAQSQGGKARRYLGRDHALVSLKGDDDPLIQELAAYEYLPAPLAGRFGIEGSFDLDLRGLQPRLLADLNGVLRAVEGSPLHLRLLRIGAVSRVVALHSEGFEDLTRRAEVPSLLPEAIKVFEVPDPRPRAYAVGRAILRAGPDEIRALLQPDFDPAREVVLSGTGPALGGGPFVATIALAALEPDRVAIDADLSHAGWVVLVDAYDPGWSVTVDGAARALLRANAAFRAVAVPPGAHRIEMRYRPPSLLPGMAVSGVGLLLSLTLLLGPAVRGRQG